MSLESGDVVTGEDGHRFEIVGLVAIQGLEGCQSPRCTRLGCDWANGDLGQCVGYHCPDCLEPTSMMGHKCPKRGES